MFFPQDFIDFGFAPLTQWGGFSLWQCGVIQHRLLCEGNAVRVCVCESVQECIYLYESHHLYSESANAGVCDQACACMRSIVQKNGISGRLEPFIKCTAPRYSCMIHEAEREEITQHTDDGPQWTGQSLRNTKWEKICLKTMFCCKEFVREWVIRYR